MVLGAFASPWGGEGGRPPRVTVVVGLGIAAGCAVLAGVGGRTGVRFVRGGGWGGLVALPSATRPPTSRGGGDGRFGWRSSFAVAGPSTVGVGCWAVGCLGSPSLLRPTERGLVSRLFSRGRWPAPPLVCGVDGRRALTRWPRRGADGEVTATATQRRALPSSPPLSPSPPPRPLPSLPWTGVAADVLTSPCGLHHPPPALSPLWIPSCYDGSSVPLRQHKDDGKRAGPY